MTKSLLGKVALITGSSRGIGRVIAEKFAAEGAPVAIVSSHDIEKSEIVAQGIKKAGGKADAFICDLSEVQNLHTLVKEVETRLGAIDILVNVAGMDHQSMAVDTSEEDFDRVMTLNFKAAYFLCALVGKSMAARKTGKIINVSSVASTLPIVGRSLYCASKAALSMVTKVLAWELGRYGVNVNSIAPGNVMTAEREAALNSPSLQPLLDIYRKAAAGPRLFSTSSEIADIALFLASPSSQSMYGAEIICDEGFSLGLNGFLDPDKKISPAS